MPSNYPFVGNAQTFLNDFAINNQFPGIEYGGTETGALYYEDREVGGAMYRTQNATFNKISQSWVLIDPTKAAYALAMTTTGAIQILTSPAGVSPFTTWTVVGNFASSLVTVGAPTGTDDTAAIQTAINTVSSSGGGIVQLQTGNYVIKGTSSGGLQLKSNVIVRGSGMNVTMVSLSASAVVSYSDIFYTNYTTSAKGSSIGLYDLSIDGAYQTNGGNQPLGLLANGANLANVDYVTVRRVHFKNTSSYGLQIWSTDATNVVLVNAPTVQNCVFENCGRTGGGDSLAGGRHLYADYSHNTFLSCNGTAIDSVYPRYFKFNNNTIGTPAASGNGAIASDFGAYGGEIIGNVFQAGAGGISLGGYLAGVGSAVPSQCVIANNVIESTSSAYGNGIAVSAGVDGGAPSTNVASDFVISGNQISSSYFSGIKLVDVSRALISGNEFAVWNSSGQTSTFTGGNGSNVTASTDYQAVFLKTGAPGTSQGCQYVRVVGNLIRGSAAAQSAIYTEMQGVDKNAFTDNTIVPGYATSNFQLSLAATQNTVFRNNNPRTVLAGQIYKPSVAVPSSGTAWQNTLNSDVVVFVAGGTVSAIAVDGVTTGLTSGAFRVPHMSTITVTYSVAPTTYSYAFDAL